MRSAYDPGEVGDGYCLTDGCTCREAEKFLTSGLADVLKPGYETFERSRFERGTCYELLNCQKLVSRYTPTSGRLVLGRSRIFVLHHLYSSLLIDSGAPVKDAQARLGHASATTTLDIYARAIGEDGRKFSDAVERAFSSVSNLLAESTPVQGERELVSLKEVMGAQAVTPSAPWLRGPETPLPYPPLSI